MSMTIFLFLAGCLLAMAAVHSKDATGISASKALHDRLQELDLLEHVRPSRRTEEMLPQALQAYSVTGRAPADQLHSLVLALQPESITRLKSVLEAIADPDSEHYGYMYSKNDLEELLHFEFASVPVMNYLSTVGVTASLSADGSFVEATARIDTWEHLLDCSFYVYQSNVDPNVMLVRSRSYTLNETIVPHVLAVFGATHLPDPHTRPLEITSQPLDRALEETLSPTDPKVLAALYNFSLTPPGNSSSSVRSTQGVLGMLGQTYSTADLTLFQRTYHLPRASVAANIGAQPVPPSACSRRTCGEASLDLQYILAIAPQADTTFFSWNGTDFLVGWMLQLLALPDIPQVLSISYGMDEAFVPPSYAAVFDLLAIRLALQGVTLLAASGDDGAVGLAARHNSFFCDYRVSFPASSPYVTAVGGTMQRAGSTAEVACQSDLGAESTSGGGFSTLYPRPVFQDAHVAAYLSALSLSEALGPVSGYASTGRGLPDVSLLATHYQVVVGGVTVQVSGTSASTPVLAALVSRLNAARRAAGASPIGWLNPALYKKASLFARDVTTGTNHCAAKGLVCCAQGFAAREGWDPVTGLGSVEVARMLAALTQSTLSATRPKSPSEGEAPSPPTAAPRPAPAARPGWVSLRQYANENCEGDVSFATSVVTGQCLPYRTQDASRGAIMFGCDAGRVHVRRFRDEDCAERALLVESVAALGCAYHAQNYYYATAETYSTELLCSEGETATPPLDEYADARYTLHSGYYGAGCGEGKVSSKDAFLQGFCLKNVENKVSVRYTATGTREVFDAETCDDDHRRDEEHLPSACTATSDFTTDLPFYNYYYEGNEDQGIGALGSWERWSVQGAGEDAPTPTPTASPTSSSYPSQGTTGREGMKFWKSSTFVYGLISMLIVLVLVVCCVRKDWLCPTHDHPRYGMQRLSTEDEDEDEEEGIALNAVRH